MSLLERFHDFVIDFHANSPGATAQALREITDPQGRSSYCALAERVVRHADEFARILELGCGDGALLEELARLRPASHLTGVDLSESDLELARKRVPNATLIAGDFTAVTFPAHSFDIVTSHLVLMLSGPLEPALAQVHRVLTPGGTFGFVVDDLNAPGGYFAHLIEVALRGANAESATSQFRPLVDRRLYDRDALAELFRTFGLTLEEFTNHVLTGTFFVDDVWAMLCRMYQIGSLDPDRRERARKAVYEEIGTGSCEIVLNFELVSARHDGC